MRSSTYWRKMFRFLQAKNFPTVAVLLAPSNIANCPLLQESPVKIFAFFLLQFFKNL